MYSGIFINSSYSLYDTDQYTIIAKLSLTSDNSKKLFMTEPESYPFYQINAFTSEPFKGNPAAVCVIDDWPGNETLQNIAADNNLSETAFLKPVDEDYEIRWFTPTTEVALCGHGTLASGFLVFKDLHPQWNDVVFHTRYSGDLFLSKEGNGILMDFPVIPVEEKVNTHGLGQLNIPVEAVYKADKLILVLKNEQAVRDFKPDWELIKQMDEFGVAVTANADDAETDMVSRFFAPQAGVPEDPVTGSLHCALADLWGSRLEKNELKARQISHRGGELDLNIKGDRVIIKGQARKVIEGRFFF